MNAVACKAILWTRQAMLILPEFLNLLMSVDRLLAIKHPIWYKDNCTLIKAWIPIMPLVLGIFTMTSYRVGYIDKVGYKKIDLSFCSLQRTHMPTQDALYR